MKIQETNTSDKKKLLWKRCPVCNQWFQPGKSNNQQTCSLKCRKEYAPISRKRKIKDYTRKCEFCGAEYTPKIAFQRFCSNICGHRAYRQRKKAILLGQTASIQVQRLSAYVPAGTYEKVGVDDVRKREGLQPLEPGKVRCLRCGKSFNSWDKKRNRVCSQCKESEEYQVLL